MKLLSGLAIAYLVIQQPAWWELALLVVALATFWRDFGALVERVRFDIESRRVMAKRGLHFDCGAETAFVTFRRQI